MKQISIVFLLIFYACLSFAQPTPTITWTGGSDTMWRKTGNWSPATIPGPCNPVVIPTVVSGRYPVLDTTVYIKGLTFSGGELYTNDNDVHFTEGRLGLSPITYRNSQSPRFINNVDYIAHRRDTTWPIQTSTNTCNRVERFEVRPGDHWTKDISNNNRQNGGYKERSEFSQDGDLSEDGDPKIPFDSTIWISYAMYIEPGGNITYHDSAYYCYLGQWHHQGTSGAPPWNFRFSGQDSLILETRTHKQHYSNPADLKTIRRDTAIVSRGEWHYLVIKVKQSKEVVDNGLIQWWLDGQSIYSASGIPIGLDEEFIGYWKFGIYRTPADDGTQPGEVDERTTLAVRYANMEVSYSSLFHRVAAPLPLD